MPFEHIDTWVFDLDNTLYNADTHVFPRMNTLMTAYVADTLKIPTEQAEIVRRDYFQRYGTTLRALKDLHGVDPHHFLQQTHDVDLAPVAPCALTAATLAHLPGRKLVFTNSPRHFAKRMVQHLGIEKHIEAIFATEDSDYIPKPFDPAYDAFIKRHGVDPKTSCMVEDMHINLVPAHARGMTTVWLHRGEEELLNHPHVHHHAHRLPEFFSHHYFETLRNKGRKP